MFRLKFLGTTATHKDTVVNVHLKLVHSEATEGTEIKLRINTTIPSHNVEHILKTKKPTNWYQQLITEIEKQFAELSRLAMS
ncbi:hypothetical protein B9G69_011035 [Bdellovibrio sp. SKB1291214]|uniref:hypothetical protein n=1 Tax=Bdellovibrio sp. SKB1291214 TaxID=1732569 RepID=UPI000B515BAC|nr:hypothetical protein [Bdellovibrio sp. SKB1291214]UYL07579.1 hypothetical protein B9G69_011035 [Bdellovibrio sp. SKB1291214]